MKVTSTKSHDPSTGGTGLGFASIRDIDAPPDVVWSILTNIEERPKCLSKCRTVERLDGTQPGEPLKAGSRFRAVTDDYAVDLTVTSIHKGDDGTEEEAGKRPRSWSIAYVGQGHRHDVSNSRTHSTTTTMIVEPIEGDEGRTRLYMTFAIVPRGLCARVFMSTCFCLCRKQVIQTVEIDMDDIAAHAEEKVSDALKRTASTSKDGSDMERATTV